MPEWLQGLSGVSVGKFVNRYKMTVLAVAAACAICSERHLATVQQQAPLQAPT
jgi:hypothetical protein